MPPGFPCFFPPVLGFTMLQLLRSLYAVAELHSCSHFKKFYKKNKILNFEKNPSFRSEEVYILMLYRMTLEI